MINNEFPRILHEMITCIDQRMENRNVDLRSEKMLIEAVAISLDDKYDYSIIEAVRKHYKRRYKLFLTLTQYKKIDMTQRYMYVFRLSRKDDSHIYNTCIED